MKEPPSIAPLNSIRSLIYTVRGEQVMLDGDLAEIYGVETKVFNQAVKRNIERFPQAFRFQLTAEEYEDLRSQSVTPSFGGALRSQIVTLEKGGRGNKETPGPVCRMRPRKGSRGPRSTGIRLFRFRFCATMITTFFHRLERAELRAQFTESAKLEQAITSNLPARRSAQREGGRGLGYGW